MRHFAAAAILAVALAAPSDAGAQRPAAHVALTHSINAPNGGWGWGEAVRATGLRVSVPVRGAAYAWAGAARADLNMVACTTDCRTSGDAWMFQAGADYRLPQIATLSPYAGAGASLEWWTGGSRTLMPHIHAGVDWRPVPVVGLRLEAQSEWQFPARLSAGVVLSLP